MEQRIHRLVAACKAALQNMRARYLAADAAHRAIQARKETEQLRLIRNNFLHFP